MSSKSLIDTNVLVYAIDNDSKFHISSYKYIKNTNDDLYTTSKNLSELLVVLTRAPSFSIDINHEIKIVSDLSTSFNILYPTESTYLLFLELLAKYKTKGLKIHDLEIISIGLENGINRFATYNRLDFKKIKEIELVEL